MIISLGTRCDLKLNEEEVLTLRFGLDNLITKCEKETKQENSKEYDPLRDKRGGAESIKRKLLKSSTIKVSKEEVESLRAVIWTLSFLDEADRVTSEWTPEFRATWLDYLIDETVTAVPRQILQSLEWSKNVRRLRKKFYECGANKCPCCKKKFSYYYVLSCNAFGATFYTDGFIDGPMYGETALLLTCPYCQKYVWLQDSLPGPENDAPAEIGDDMDLDLYRLELGKPIEGKRYEDALKERVWTNIEQEKYVRIRAWWSFNQKYRDQTMQEFCLLPDEEGNLTRLVALLNSGQPEELLMRAEILRELGSFKDALDVLDTKLEDEYLQVADTIRHLAESEIRRVSRIA